MHHSPKPVGKCHGCGLNLEERCGMFPDPHTMWKRHSVCPGYKNEALLAEYQAAELKRQKDASKARRQAKAKERRAVPHHNGDRHVVMVAGRR